jgi:hypothetical protein
MSSFTLTCTKDNSDTRTQFVDLDAMKIVGEGSPTSESVTVVAEFTKRLAYQFVCYSIRSDGTKSVVSNTAIIAVGTSPYLSTGSLQSFISGIARLSTSSTTNARQQFVRDLNTASSGLGNLDGTDTATVADSLLSMMSSNVFTSVALIDSEKDSYAIALQRSVEKMISVQVSTSVAAVKITDAIALTSVSLFATTAVLQAIDKMIMLMQISFKTLLPDAVVYNVGRVIKNAFTTCRIYASSASSTFSFVGSYMNVSQSTSPFKPSTTSTKCFLFQFQTTPFRSPSQSSFNFTYGYACGNAVDYVPTDIVASFVNAQLHAYDAGSDKLQMCKMLSNAVSLCTSQPSTSPPIYFSITPTNGSNFINETLPVGTLTPINGTLQSNSTNKLANVSVNSEADSNSMSKDLTVGLVAGIGGFIVLGLVCFIGYHIYGRKQIERRRSLAALNQQNSSNPIFGTAKPW